MALCILLEPIEAGRRIDRHGHAAGEERAEEGREEILLAPEHERDRVPPPKPSRMETAGDRQRPRAERSVGDRPLTPVALLEEHVHALRGGLGLPAQDLGEGAERCGRRRPRGGRRRRLAHDRPT